jgi:hypothetical protein
VEQAFALRREEELDLAMVVLGARAGDETAGFDAVDELDGAVMLELHALGEHRDAVAVARADGQEKLMLLRLDARGTRCFLTEMQKAPNRVAEVVQ